MIHEPGDSFILKLALSFKHLDDFTDPSEWLNTHKLISFTFTKMY